MIDKELNGEEPDDTMTALLAVRSRIQTIASAARTVQSHLMRNRAMQRAELLEATATLAGLIVRLAEEVGDASDDSGASGASNASNASNANASGNQPG